MKDPGLAHKLNQLSEPALNAIDLLADLFANLSPKESQALAAFVMNASQAAHAELMAGARPQRKVSGPKKRTTAGAIYQLKVTLKGSKPPIWRRVLIGGECGLDKVHAILQAAMGWHDAHLHSFSIDDEEYGPSMPGEPVDWHDEKHHRLDEVASEGGTLTYLYDFGDGWEHKVTVERVLARNPKLRYPTVVMGKGACPPEDSGGLWGYYDKLDVLKKPDSEEYDEVAEWMGDFDPNAFSVEEADQSVSVWARA